MKRKDIVLIVVVTIVAGVFALLISNVLISSPNKRKERVEVVEAISSEFKDPKNNGDLKNYLNAQSIDPTRIIQIGDTLNQKPFNGTN